MNWLYFNAFMTGLCLVFTIFIGSTWWWPSAIWGLCTVMHLMGRRVKWGP